MVAAGVLAHPVAEGNAAFVSALAGPAPAPFMYLGAKHMVTGYDHLLYLVGVVFFLRGVPDLLLYVSLFTLGHSLTLILGVLLAWHVNASLIDAAIGLSVAYKAFENLGGLAVVIGTGPDPRVAVFGFGLIHGLGLSTRVQDLGLAENGLLTNLFAFNVGVELGQLLALALVLVLLAGWRRGPRFPKQAFAANTVLMSAGFLLAGLQFSGFLMGFAS